MTDDISADIQKLWLAVEALASAIIAQQGVLVPVVLGSKLESMFPERDHVKMTGEFNQASAAISAYLKVSGDRHRPDKNLEHLETILEVLRHTSRPKRLVRGADGKVTGIETVEN